MEVHKQAVAAIAKAVRSHYERREPFRIFHGSTNSTRPGAGARGGGRGVVDISALSHVLAVDTAARTALVEPNVPMDRLVAATLARGLVPPVVMEFPGITAGGGYAGTAGESSSFRHGFFDQTVRRVEMVLGSGDVVEATPDLADPRRDLFRGAAGALGTLGTATLLELQLVPARRYVRTTYRRCASVAETIAAVRDAADPLRSRFDYVDGILFGRHHGVVITGEMTDDEPSESASRQTFSQPRDPWFYLHVRDHTAASLSPDEPATEYVPLAEYLFRYDRGGFWVGRSAFSYFPFPFNRWTRRFLDDFLHTRMLYKALHASGQSSTYVVQDLALPYTTAADFVDYTADTFGIWPLWLCPLQPSARPTFHPHSKLAADTVVSAMPPQQMLNVGLWGPGPSDAARCVELNRDLEHRLGHDFGGMKWLYAHAYYDEDEFWRLYDRPAYDALRQKYHATSLPSVYDKVKVDPARHTSGASSWSSSLLTSWPLAGAVGLRHAIASKAYLPRTPPWRT
ncbi:FAD-binding domain containing protein [Grosmannia clavigera kw1407]|uniref:Delta(24)-sterol reductase n=1 Tax=Grosmannia clavigera (strain kw1407 / UAMH 11150) TaxID=655863 RepID=F0XV27_GROCL|nr:FAD-binding domain containing protein [Grosmannia clavigera kw1407]EFW98569.1 FAD-binding domain containing protein [Grosmannia clavigera kw1407]